MGIAVSVSTRPKLRHTSIVANRVLSEKQTVEIVRLAHDGCRRNACKQFMFGYEVTGFSFSGLMPRSLMALSITVRSILPSWWSSWSVASVMLRASTSKKSRND
jgi:hypothetical protein